MSTNVGKNLQLVARGCTQTAEFLRMRIVHIMDRIVFVAWGTHVNAAPLAKDVGWRSCLCLQLKFEIWNNLKFEIWNSRLEIRDLRFEI